MVKTRLEALVKEVGKLSETKKRVEMSKNDLDLIKKQLPRKVKWSTFLRGVLKEGFILEQANFGSAETKVRITTSPSLSSPYTDSTPKLLIPQGVFKVPNFAVLEAASSSGESFQDQYDSARIFMLHGMLEEAEIKFSKAIELNNTRNISKEYGVLVSYLGVTEDSFKEKMRGLPYFARNINSSKEMMNFFKAIELEPSTIDQQTYEDMWDALRDSGYYWAMEDFAFERGEYEDAFRAHLSIPGCDVLPLRSFVNSKQLILDMQTKEGESPVNLSKLALDFLVKEEMRRFHIKELEELNYDQSVETLVESQKAKDEAREIYGAFKAIKGIISNGTYIEGIVEKHITGVKTEKTSELVRTHPLEFIALQQVMFNYRISGYASQYGLTEEQSVRLKSVYDIISNKDFGLTLDFLIKPEVSSYVSSQVIFNPLKICQEAYEHAGKGEDFLNELKSIDPESAVSIIEDKYRTSIGRDVEKIGAPDRDNLRFALDYHIERGDLQKARKLIDDNRNLATEQESQAISLIIPPRL